MKKIKIFLSLSIFCLSCCGEKIVYKSQEEINHLRKQEIWDKNHAWLPKEAELIEILESLEQDWCIIKIRNNCYLYRMNYNGNGTTEIMVPFNPAEK